MGKKRMIDTDFWTDSWVVDRLNPLDSHLFLYLFTNPMTTLCGVYKISLRIMSFQTGIEKEELSRMLKRLEPKVYYVNGWVVLKNGIKNQNYHNSKIASGILAGLEDVPCEILQHVLWPKDFGKPKPKGLEQMELIDGSYMTNDDSSHLNVIKTVIENEIVIENENETKPAKAGHVERVSSETIDGMFKYWEMKVGYSVTSKIKSNREACSKLVKEYPKDAIASMIQAAAVASEDQYAPGVSNFIDLYTKWDKLKLWGKKKGSLMISEKGIKL